MDFIETYAPVGKLTIFRYLISLVGKYDWNIDQLDVGTAFFNPEVDEEDIYMTLPEGWPEGLNAPMMIVPIQKALYSLKLAPRLEYNDINTFLLFLEFTQSQADPNFYLNSDGILMLLYVDDISMLYPKNSMKAVIQVNARLMGKFKITNLGPARQFLGIKIIYEQHRTATGICLGQKALVTTILKRFNLQKPHNVSTAMEPNVTLDLAEDLGETEPKDIQGY